MTARTVAEILLLGLTIMVGQGCARSGPGVADTVEPDLGAITTVVKDVYRQEGRSRMIFLAAEPNAVDESTLATAESTLEQDLSVKVRPASEATYASPDVPIFTPVLAETGEVGISIQLGRFRDNGDGTRSVTVFWNRSCGERAWVDYVLRSDDQGWLVESRDVRPDVLGCY